MGAFADHAKNFGAAAVNHAKAHGPAAASAAGGAARTVGAAVSGAYKAAGGFRGAAEHVRQYAAQGKADYQGLHGNMPGVKDYVTSDAGRATARHAAGGAFHQYLAKQAKAGARKGTIGGAVKNALFSFAHQALQSHMDALKHDQRIFENVAKVRRGDPEVQHMSHVHLREVERAAHKYGGPKHEEVKNAARDELSKRQNQKNAEWDAGEAHRDNLKAKRHENMAGVKAKTNATHKDEAHQAKLKRMAELRTESGHTQAAKIAHEAQKNKMTQEHLARQAKVHKEIQDIKTKGAGNRAKIAAMRAKAQEHKTKDAADWQALKKSGGVGAAAKANAAKKLNIIGKTASGRVKVRAQSGGGVYTVDQATAAKSQKASGAGKSATPKAPRARRARSVG